MATEPLESLERAIGQAGKLYSRLVLVVGRSGSGKSELLRESARDAGHRHVIMGIELGRRLLDLSRRERPLLVGGLLHQVVAEGDESVVLLDNLELLFEPSLAVRPFDLLRSVSRNRTVVAAWGGTYAGGILTYARPGHPEHQRIRDADAITIHLDQGVATAPRPSHP